VSLVHTIVATQHLDDWLLFCVCCFCFCCSLPFSSTGTTYNSSVVFRMYVSFDVCLSFTISSAGAVRNLSPAPIIHKIHKIKHQGELQTQLRLIHDLIECSTMNNFTRSCNCCCSPTFAAMGILLHLPILSLSRIEKVNFVTIDFLKFYIIYVLDILVVAFDSIPT
jgi:hypothetical protein